MGKILPLLMALVGVGAGIGAGLAFKPESAEVAMETDEADAKDMAGKPAETSKNKAEKADKDDAEATLEYAKLNNQFLVPVVVDELIDSLVVMNLSVEIKAGQGEVIYSREPKLRDAFTTALFRHANTGGFDGVFTSTPKMNALRVSLTESARNVLGDAVLNVLVMDLVRQDA